MSAPANTTCIMMMTSTGSIALSDFLSRADTSSPSAVILKSMKTRLPSVSISVWTNPISASATTLEPR